MVAIYPLKIGRNILPRMLMGTMTWSVIGHWHVGPDTGSMWLDGETCSPGNPPLPDLPISSQPRVNRDLFTLGLIPTRHHLNFVPVRSHRPTCGLPFKHSPWPRRRPADGGRRRGGRLRRPRWAPPRGCSSTPRCCTTWCGARPRPSSGGGTRSIRWIIVSVSPITASEWLTRGFEFSRPVRIRSLLHAFRCE